MAKNKLQKFADVDRFTNVFEYTDFKDQSKPKGTWHDRIFENENPITLELACGKGEYTVNLARKFPGRNFVGIDKKGWRIWTGAKTALEEPLPNVHFMRIFIDHLKEYFEPGEVDEIWITFPDPYLEKSNIKKRLTSPKFLEIYRKVMRPGGIVHLKTDSEKLYAFTQEVIEEQNLAIVDRVDDLYAERPDDSLLSIKTYYEKMHLEAGKTIHYIAFQI
jgi:tRNA (guanine-N7-)-methyltransferase